jgi:hypothetical protein
VLRRIFGSERFEMSRDWGKCITRSSIICTFHQMFLGKSNLLAQCTKERVAYGLHEKHNFFAGKPEGKMQLGRIRPNMEG